MRGDPNKLLQHCPIWSRQKMSRQSMISGPGSGTYFVFCWVFCFLLCVNLYVNERLDASLNNTVRCHCILRIYWLCVVLLFFNCGRQYKPEIVQRHPELDYHAYNGTGNVYKYMDRNVDFVDLTFPIGLPKRDWVLSLEVGEHVPSMFEGMFIRNLHWHNTHGIILSWGILGQPGHSHVNNHSNDYIIAVFESLGYKYQKHWTDKFRNPNDNYKWFTKSVMVFKRKILLVAWDKQDRPSKYMINFRPTHTVHIYETASKVIQIQIV